MALEQGIEGIQREETYNNLDIVLVANDAGLAAGRDSSVGGVSRTNHVFADEDLTPAARPSAAKGPARALVKVVCRKKVQLAKSILNASNNEGRGGGIVRSIDDGSGPIWPKCRCTGRREVLDGDHVLICAVNWERPLIEDGGNHKRLAHTGGERSSRLNRVGEIVVKDGADGLTMACGRVDEATILLHVAPLKHNILQGNRVLARR